MSDRSKETIIGYRCPKCAGTIYSPIGIFSLSANFLRLNCPCGGSSTAISKTPDGRIKLTVPCFACGGTHSCTVSEEVFFGADVFPLTCSITGVEICYFGKKELIEQKFAEQNRILRDVMGDGEEKSEKDDPDEFVNVAEFYNMGNFILSELIQDAAVHCDCGEGKGDYSVECAKDRITLLCRKCGREKTFIIENEADREAFLSLGDVVLNI